MAYPLNNDNQLTPTLSNNALKCNFPLTNWINKSDSHLLATEL